MPDASSASPRSPLDPAEPIAVIGMSGRFAGAADPASLWHLLRSGSDAITEIPFGRYDVGPLYDPRPRVPGRTVSRWGGFVEGIAEFDADFFGISPKEADRMDPQQRMLLEVAYEALEDAGQPLEALAGSDAGVFVGQLGGDYWHMQYQDRDRLDLYSMTGSASRAITSGRLSYAFDLRGPSFTVDTACSSALVAVHNAMQALRLGECGLALAGGVNLVLLPEEGVVYSGAGMLARDGRCKFGDASGDGFVRSDGVGTVVLKSLSRALADGDRVRAVLRGSAVGNDGRSSGYLVTPGADGQREVVRRAYENAGVDPADVDYVEAHGTGTVAGDPVELEALGDVLGAGRPADRPALVGSVKTNIGHAEAAAGIAGLIKAVLCLEHGEVPPSLHLHDPNPAVPWDRLPVSVPTAVTPLPDRGRPALAGVSSFGFSGTNAHLVLEAAPSGRPGDAPKSERPELLTLSARSPEALIDLAASYAGHLTTGAGRSQQLHDLCHSAATRRSTLDARLALPVTSREQAAEALRAFAQGEDEPDLSFTDYVESGTVKRIAFVFPGQGSQWVGMGRELLDTEPVFADAMRACDTAIKNETGWSVIDLLRSGPAERFKELDVIQPTLWAMEIALAAFWRSWGVEPDVVIGHSMGESAAAYVAGALTLEDAAAVICRRSRLAKRLTGRGTMAWVALPADEAAAALAGHEDSVAVAAANSPTSTLLSGDGEALTAVLAALEARGVVTRWVKVDFASHCPQMDALREDLLSELKDLAPRPSAVAIHSTLLGEVVDGAGMDAAYWARNIREPVDFVGAVRHQIGLGDTVFIEVSPHPLLVNGIKETGRSVGRETVAVGSLRREDGERTAMLAAAGALWTCGALLAPALFAGTGRHVDLPHYPWQRTTHWLPDAPIPAAGSAEAPGPAPAAAQPRHPLLGPETAPDGSTRIWTGTLDLDSNAYLADHRIQGTVIVPGTAYLELMHAAMRQVAGDRPVALADVAYHQALFLDDGAAPPSVRVTAAPAAAGTFSCQVLSRSADDESWTLHARATGRGIDMPGPEQNLPALEEIRGRLPEHQAAAEFYAHNAERGNQWQGAFQGVTELWRTDGEVLARIVCPEQLRASLDVHLFHPALLDAGGHSMAAARRLTVADPDNVFVLGGIDETRFYDRPGTELYCHAVLVPSDRDDSFTADLVIRDPHGGLLAEMRGLRLQYLAGTAPREAEPQPGAMPVPESLPAAPSALPLAPPPAAPSGDWLHDLRWQPSRRDSATGTAPGTWVVFTDSGTAGRNVARSLRAEGRQVVVVTAAASLHAGGTELFRIDPAVPEHYATVLAETARLGPIAGIVHLWALDANCGLDASPREIARARRLACHSVLHLVQALKATEAEPALWLLTQHAQATGAEEPMVNPFQATLWGLGRTLAAEHPRLRTRLVDLDRERSTFAELPAELLHPDEEAQIALRAGHRRVARLVRRGTQQPMTPAAGDDSTVRLTLAAPGVIDDLHLAAHPRRAPEAGEVEIRVSHAALNYRDVLLSVGLYPGQDDQPPVLGWECVGTVTRVGEGVEDVVVGDEVIAFADGAMAAHVVTRATLTAPKPDRLTAAEAATLPASYLTAYHSLVDLARIGRGDRVLIHSGTGGTGLAAINIAQWKGAEVFATAGSPEKRLMLEHLGVRHVADSRSLQFVDDFRLATDKNGFDAIVNTLVGEAIPANLSLTAPYGHYLELSKRDILTGETLNLAPFACNLSFHAVDVVHMIQHAPHRAGACLRAAARLVGQGVLKPLPYREFDATDARSAFRLMAQSRHTGKLVLAFPDSTLEAAAPAPSVPEPAPRASTPVRGDGTYLVTGGTGGIGGELATWLVEHGARHLLLTGRTALPDPEGAAADHPNAAQLALLRDLTARGADVQYAAVDAGDYPAMRTLLDDRARAGRPPVTGVFHAAGTIDYAPLSDLTPDDLDAVLRAKVSGGWALHRLAQGAPVEQFVLFSSGSAILASPMLGGYAAGNAFLDALAQHRRATGHSATVVDWGFWDSVGMVARKQQEDGRSLLPRGISAFTPEDGLGILGRLLTEGATQTVVFAADWPQWAAAYPDAAAAPLLADLIRGHTPGQPRLLPATEYERSDRPAAPPALPAPRPAPAETLPATHQEPPRRDNTEPPQTATAPVSTPPSTTPTAPEAVMAFLRAQTAEVLGLRPERVNVNRPLNRMGMDSLMAVELRNRVEREFRTQVPIVKILKDGTLTAIAEALAEAGGAPAPDRPDTGSAGGAMTVPVAEPRPAAPESLAAPEPDAPTAGASPGAEQVMAFLRAQTAEVLGLRPERVNVNRPLNRMGMDSLMAVELRNRIEREFRTQVPIVKILKDGTLTGIAQALGEAGGPESSPTSEGAEK
ncbi:type I polyketide synthase [Streptomyces sp. NPDC021020]|uniref:type I polyketide synthase n=1 Tax=Streptomyces sp. NPDC021020 TaxID=3365109 RepID=UPI00378AA04D